MHANMKQDVIKEKKGDNVKRYTKKIISIFIFVWIAVICVSCHSAKISSEYSPCLVDVQLKSYNNGTEDSQFVQVDLIFDREIAVVSEKFKNLKILIAGNRIKEDAYTLEQGEDEKTARITISVQAVTTGVLSLEKVDDVISEIRSADKKYSVQDFSVETMIPSGVTLSTIKSGAGKIVKSVDSAWNIRSIAWIGILENGDLIEGTQTKELETLDGYSAVHGHEFLEENENNIAKEIVEVLEKNYPSEYGFCCDKNKITIEKENSEDNLDLVIYQYTKINQKNVETTENSLATEIQANNENGDGIKTKQEIHDREITLDEQNFLDKLHISKLASSESGQIIDGNALYQTITITGDSMPEEQIYSVRDLENLIQLSFENEKMNQLNLPIYEEGLYGLDFLRFLELCGVDWQEKDLNLLMETKDGETKTIAYQEICEQNGKLWLVFADDGKYSEFQGSELAIVSVQKDKKEFVCDVNKVIIGTGNIPEDPQYRYHNREGYLESKEVEFRIEIYQQNAEYLGAVKTIAVTTEEMEQMMCDHPEMIVRNYYGTIGDEEFFSYMGAGGWLDYFEGIDLYWLLKEKAGIENLEGYAEFIGRDGEVYGKIEDLNYLTDSKNKESYYILTKDGAKITGCVPMIACVKNGYPILPEHDHESELYIPYNHLNQTLEEKGVITEVGVVKNHNGPFVACLGNKDGYYGGNQVETGGDCVSIRFYLK